LPESVSAAPPIFESPNPPLTELLSVMFPVPPIVVLPVSVTAPAKLADVTALFTSAPALATPLPVTLSGSLPIA
jgi:hypothetical protein